jgi:hypothetical protein
VTIDGIVLDSTYFEPIQPSEERLEGLLRTAAPAVFPGMQYFDFRPAIRCGAGTRHPDGVLVSPGLPRWWVVEVETHLHSVSDHIEPQLQDLATGFYGPEVFAYLTRDPSFEPSQYNVDSYQPEFLLVIDTLTPEVRDAATRTGFQAVECGVFRSQENRYALAVTGPRPRRDTAAGPGLDLRLEERDGVAVLVPVDGKPVPSLKSLELVVGHQIMPAFALSGRAGIVLPLSTAELRDAIGASSRYRLAATGHLTAITESALVAIEE